MESTPAAAALNLIGVTLLEQSLELVGNGIWRKQSQLEEDE